MAQSPKTPPETKDTVEAAEAGNFVMIATTNGKSRRRAGLRFTPEGVKVDVAALSRADQEAIERDPMLKVSKAKG